MSNRRFLTAFSLPLFALLPIAACSTTDDGSGAPASCSGLDTQARAQASLRAYAEAVTSLRSRALEVEAKFLAVCNDINGELGLDTSKKTAADACAVLHQRVQAAAKQGIGVEVRIDFNCRADFNAQAQCEGKCQASADCDIEAHCKGGEVVVECNGMCSGSCDVTAPSVACEGSCDGSCSVDVSGKCDGECQGTCSGTTKNGQCQGTCQGSCVTQTKAKCEGKCNGTCSYEPGSASCKGTCHGECDAAVSPPTCTGKLDCEASAECHGSCQAQASAEVDCPPPHATVVITGDAELEAALLAHIDDFGQAVNLTLALKDPIANVAGKTVGAFEAIGDIGVSGAACMATSLSAAVEAQASISVSVQASASVSASSK